MIVLLTGANGFIGRHIADRLRAAGHQPVLAVRDPSRLAATRDVVAGTVIETPLAPLPIERCIIADLATDHGEAVWAQRLQGVEAVVNAAGIFREQNGATFDAVHARGPAALFRACARVGVPRVIQISALGATADAPTSFLRSKWAADDALLGLPLSALVLQPSLVYGCEGVSSQLFLQMATWPLLPLPGGGAARVQPVHVDDLADAVVAALAAPDRVGRLAAVGPVALPLRSYIATLRRGLGLSTARIIPLPMAIANVVARVPALSGGWLDRDALAMLGRDNCADAGSFATLLNRPLRSPVEFIPLGAQQRLARDAQLAWLLPLLRLALALVWLTAGVVSLGLYPLSESLALLAATGITGWFAWLLLYGAAAVDLIFGVGILVLRRRLWLWRAQLAVIVFYTAVITVALPEFWLHPYGPIVKNLPIIAAILLLMNLER